MAELQIDYLNRVGKCEFRPASAEEVAKLRKHRPQDFKDKSDEQIALDYGKIFIVGKVKEVRVSARIMQDTVKILVEHEKINRPFHQIALKLSNAIGIHSHEKYGDDILYWRHVANVLRTVAEGVGYGYEGKQRKKEYWPHPFAQQVGQIGIFLVPGEGGKPVLALRPESLQDALVLYLARMRANGTTFQLCEHCHVPFLSGGQEGRGGGRRRGDARFCSDECRYGFHNERRRKTGRKTKL